MLNHLVGATEIEALDDMEPAFEPVKRASPQKILSAQHRTSAWLAELGAPGDEEVVEQEQREAAREAFGALVTAQPEQTQKESLLRIKSPVAMAHLGRMLEAHDWEFVERAKELRSYAVTSILKETEHHDARIRLRALELLGKVTEVGLFTERVEIKKVEVGDTELEARVREKLERFLVSSGQLEDIETVELKGDTNDDSRQDKGQDEIQISTDPS